MQGVADQTYRFLVPFRQGRQIVDRIDADLSFHPMHDTRKRGDIVCIQLPDSSMPLRLGDALQILPGGRSAIVQVAEPVHFAVLPRQIAEKRAFPEHHRLGALIVGESAVGQKTAKADQSCISRLRRAPGTTILRTRE